VEALRDALIARDELVGEEIVGVIHEALARRDPELLIDLTDPDATSDAPEPAAVSAP